MMSTPGTKPWYQFSLRSLLLLTVFVAVLCSTGVRSHWSVAATIAVGGVAGGIIAMSWLGLVLGVLSGGLCAVVMAAICVVVWRLLFRVPFLMWISSSLDGVIERLCYTTWTMSTPEADKRPFQFSVGSLLLVTFAAVVIFSISTYTCSWFFAVSAWNMLIAGVVVASG